MVGFHWTSWLTDREEKDVIRWWPWHSSLGSVSKLSERFSTILKNTTWPLDMTHPVSPISLSHFLPLPPQVLPSLLCPPPFKSTIRTPMPPPRYGRKHQWWTSWRGRVPPPSPSSTLGLNDARFRGRWAGKPRSSETGSVISTVVAQLCPSRSLPTCFLLKPREEFEECPAPFTATQHGRRAASNCPGCTDMGRRWPGSCRCGHGTLGLDLVACSWSREVPH